MNNATIRDALNQMDPTDDDQWTSEGLPRTEAVGAIVGGKVSRQEITAAAPKFGRENLEVPESDPEPEPDVDPLEEEAAEDPGPELEFEEENEAETIDPDSPEIPEDELEPDSREDHDRAIEAKVSELGDMKVKHAVLGKEIEEVAKEVAGMIDARNREFPPKSAAEAIREYTDRQAELRQARHAGRVQLEEIVGGRVGDTSGKAPIDSAMQRRTGHGLRRPQFGPPRSE